MSLQWSIQAEKDGETLRAFDVTGFTTSGTPNKQLPCAIVDTDESDSTWDKLGQTYSEEKRERACPGPRSGVAAV